MGRPARRYIVDNGHFREEYYVDPSSGAPPDSIRISEKHEPEITADGRLRPGARKGMARKISVVERIERLPATAENLRKVRER